MIKLDNSIMQDIECEELRGYWSDFDEGRVAFTMEVNNNDLDGQLNDLEDIWLPVLLANDLEDIIQLMEVYND